MFKELKEVISSIMKEEGIDPVSENPVSMTKQDLKESVEYTPQKLTPRFRRKHGSGS